MKGGMKGIMAGIRNEILKVQWTHRILQKEGLAFKKIISALHDV